MIKTGINFLPISLLILSLIFSCSLTGITYASSDSDEAELAIIYYGMADDKTIMTRGRLYMNDAEWFGDSQKVKFIFEFSNWPDGEINGSWLNWSTDKWRSYSKDHHGEQGRIRYVITSKDTDKDEIAQKEVHKTPKTDSQNPSKNIRELLRWTHNNHPAKRYLLFLHGHGGGSRGTSGFASVKELGEAVDLLDEAEIDEARLKLLKHSLTKAAEDKEIAERLAVVAFSSCLMQTVGVSYELSSVIDKMVAASISMIGTDYKRTIASIMYGRRIPQNYNLNETTIDAIVSTFDKDPDSSKTTPVALADQAVNVMYDRGAVRWSSNAYTSSVTNTDYMRDNVGDKDKDVAIMLSKFADDFMKTAVGDNRDKYYSALHEASIQSQRYSMSYPMYADMSDFFKNLYRNRDLPNSLRDQARVLSGISKTSTDSLSEPLKNNSKGLLGKSMSRSQSTVTAVGKSPNRFNDIKYRFRLPRSHGLSFLFPIYMEAILIKNLNDNDGNQVTDDALISAWVFNKVSTGNMSDIIATPLSFKNDYQVKRFAELSINKPASEGGKVWSDLVKSYWDWAKPRPRSECPYIVVFKNNSEGKRRTYGYILSRDLLEHGYGFNVQGESDFVFLKK